MKDRERWILSASVLVICLLIPFSSAGQTLDSLSMKAGPFLDHVRYQVISNEEQLIQALMDDEIDLIGDTINTSYVDTLVEVENIEIGSTLRNGYGYLSINCEKYPLNITEFRRAFAFALDKERLCEEVFDGFAFPQDSCVPRINPFSVEGLLDYSYYESDIEYADYLLDTAGFLDVDDDGYREAPDGSDFNILIEADQSSPISVQIGEIASETLQNLGVDAVSVPSDFYEYLNHNWWHLMRSYDIVYLGSSFTNFDVDWLAYEYWSEYADEPYWNFPHWRNATYDSWRDQLLRATNYDDVYAAAIEMQKIWIYDCPMVICCEEELLSAYRTDHIDGIVNDARYGASGWWTNYRTFVKYSYNLHYGGTLRIGMLLGVDTFNFMLYSSIYTKKVLDNLYDSLIRQSPDGTDFPWLATSYFFETHEDNPAIQEGHTRIFFTIIENATWSDGTPLTALDVAYTMNYYRDAPGNPYGADLSEMTAAYNISNHQVIIEFNSESYWHIHTIGYKPIIPKHVFEVIGLDYWNSWNPSPPEEDMVTSGPYNITDQVPDEYVELSRNRNYFYTPRDLLSTELNPSESIPTDAGPIPLQHLFVTIPSVIVIIAVAIKWKRDSSAM